MVSDTMNTAQQEIYLLIAELESSASPIGDWKITKYYEHVLAGLPAPYDIQELHAKRQAIRDKINELKESIK